MKIVADLHIHSHFSRATSKTLDFEHLHLWAQRKGVNVVGTGDIAHPGWLQEMHDKLEPAEPGLFRLKPELAATVDKETPPACLGTVRFLLAGEISNIYKKNDRVRKVHNVIFAPNLDAVARIQARLEQIGNIRSDGRPILGLDSRDLFEIVLEVDASCHLIPAHIWTPWFSMLGSKSGFDTVEECFDDLTPHIFAVETGLSSDPPMNWRLSMLDDYTLVSSSDAHSPPKLAREATLFDTELSYAALFDALRSADPDLFRGTIEFFPEEGKYHHDGHRKCNVNWLPKTTLAHDGLCEVCGKPVTVGVSHRVEELADRDEPLAVARPPFYSLIPLPEILAELHGVGVNTKRVNRDYEQLLRTLGPELAILRELPLEEIARAAGGRLAEGIARMRRGEVTATAGYDGEYGVIKLFDDAPQSKYVLGDGWFETAENSNQTQAPQPPALQASGDALFVEHRVAEPSAKLAADGNDSALATQSHPLLDGLNEQQREAVRCIDRPLIIVAGPGAGKTRTLTHRIAYLVAAHDVAPEKILAITFTNKAANEMRERLDSLMGEGVAAQLTVKTFHALGVSLLREFCAQAGIDADFAIYSDEDRKQLLRLTLPDASEREISAWLETISAVKNRMVAPDNGAPGDGAPESEQLADFDSVFSAYQLTLRDASALDFDDLIVEMVRLLESSTDARRVVHDRYRWISVDEYQDLNYPQFRLLRLLANGGANVCVIGDPDQAIYGFRGADSSYFASFADDYPGAQTIHLSRNYRSTQLILDAAQQVIEHSPDRAALEIWSDFVSRTKLDLHPAPTDKAEAEYVVHQIERMTGGVSYFSLDSGRVDDRQASVSAQSRTFGDFAVLYRTSAQNRALVEALDRSGFPYQIVGQTPLYAHSDVRYLLAHLWLLHNPRSTVHWQTVLGQGRRLFTAGDLGILMDAVSNADGWMTDIIPELPVDLSSAQSRRLATVLRLLCSLAAQEKTNAVVDQVGLLIEELDGESNVAGSQAHQARLDQLLRRAALFANRLGDFLESTLLEREADDYDPRADRIALMTLHASKGLEFPVVFIVGCEEGLLPYVREGEETDVDEERRLFYVGMTRAQEKLALSHARSRFLFGQRMENAPSRFVADIEDALKEISRMAPRKSLPVKDSAEQLSLF